MLYSVLYNMLRCNIASAYNMLNNILCYIAPTLYNTPCYITVFACFLTHSHSTCYVPSSYIAPHIV